MTAPKKKMNPLSVDLGNALLARHAKVCGQFQGRPEDVTESLIQEAIIAYKPLLASIGAPVTLAIGIGTYLVELARWSEKSGLSPINALAVNGDYKQPGPGYYNAPGGKDWGREIRECIACKSYPQEISN